MTWTPTEDERAEEIAFRRLYGDWDALDPADTADFMADYPGEWWIVGGWAIEAFTQVPRRHDDIDLVIWRRDLPLLREHVGDRHHIWSAGGGAIRPLNDDWPEPHEQAGQVWLRDHATAPWFLDCILSEDVEGQWLSRRDPEHVAPIEDVTWVADDGIRYMLAEVVLHHKARLLRPKDTADVVTTWPLLDLEAQAWLRGAVRKERADHPWLTQTMGE